jgi:hypothetical protein
MKKVILVLFLSFSVSSCFSQDVLDILKKVIGEDSKNTKPKTLNTIKIISTTKKLNGGVRAAFGSGFGATSRVAIPINLPENTVEWYYSFTTTNGGSGGFNNALKLAVQVGSIVSNLSTAGIASIFTRGLSQSAVNSIEVPNGSMAVNTYLLDVEYLNPFIQKKEFSYYESESSLQSTQSLVRINKFTKGKFYLGLQNISSTSAVEVQVEVVAIVAE